MAHNRLSRHAGLGTLGEGCDTAGHDHDTADSARSDTPVTRPRHGRAQATIRPGEDHDTTPGAPRHD